jgi:GT2 family glycosyltransferase
VGSSLPSLTAQLREGDELVVVDNASADGSAEAVRELAPAATVIEAGANLGYGGGCNRGAEAASGELLCFLNPDAVIQPGWRDAIEVPHAGRGWVAWQGLVTAEGGRIVNTRGGVVHFTGIAWAGGAGEPVEDWSGWTGYAPIQPGFVSGACLVVARQTFLDAGGFSERFFLYQEDVDLSLRLRLRGGELGVEGDAVVDHDYEFEKGPAKWRYLERNRWATILRTYPPGLLLLVMPALLATELALVPISIAGGWFGQKVRSWVDVIGWLPRLLEERRAIQRERQVGAGEFARRLTPDLNSAYLGRAGASRLLQGGLRLYWRIVLALLGGRG